MPGGLERDIAPLVGTGRPEIRGEGKRTQGREARPEGVRAAVCGGIVGPGGHREAARTGGAGDHRLARGAGRDAVADVGSRTTQECGVAEGVAGRAQLDREGVVTRTEGGTDGARSN